MSLSAAKPSRTIAAAMILLLAAGCARAPQRPSERILVAASIAPLYYFSKQIGGAHVDVHLLVPPGANAHTYQLRPDQMKALSRAKVLVLNGIGLEYWADKAVGAADNPDLVVIKTAEGLPLEDAVHDAAHPRGNPHVWLDPVFAGQQVEMIRDAFIEADPTHTSDYKAGADRVIRRLRALDTEIRDEVKTFRSRSFVSFHPAWVYFANRYGLTEAASIEESPGKEPSPTRLREVVETAKRLRAKAIFAEPQSSPKAAEVVAEEVGAKVLFLDPLGRPPSYSYFDMMRRNVSEMAKALR